jgi:hypothetical protein
MSNIGECTRTLERGKIRKGKYIKKCNKEKYGEFSE